MKFYLLPIILLTHVSLTAQTLSGYVVDTEKRPVEYANAVLLNFSDSTFVSGCISDENGFFRFEKSGYGKRILEISCLGFVTQRITIEESASSALSDSIVLEQSENRLLEITVTARKHPFSRKGNNLTANVEFSSLSSLGTAKDILQRFPGITFNKDNDMSVFGKGTPVVYINNRKVYDLNELQRLKSTDIATVELNLTPGAEYDAEGRALLIIKTKRNNANGWAAQLSETETRGNYWNDRENIGLDYTHNTLHFFASYEHFLARQNRNPYGSYTVRTDTLWQLTTDIPQKYTDSNHQFAFGTEWSITPDHTVGGQYQYVSNPTRLASSGTNVMSADGVLYDCISSGTRFEIKPAQHISNVFYEGKRNESLRWHLDLDYVAKNSRMNQTVDEVSVSDERTVHLTSRSDFVLYAGKLTVTYDLRQSGRIVAGGESNRIEGSDALYNTEQYVENTFYTNLEKKTAGFLSYDNSFDKYRLQAGIRYEYTHEQFTDDKLKQLIVDRQYHRFYPNVSLSYSSETMQTGVSWSQKTKRPSFAQLNGINFYANRWVIQKGNPQLKNETIFQLDYYWSHKFLDITCGYIYEKNPVSLAFENSGHRTVMSYINFHKYQELNASLRATFKSKFLETQADIGLRQPFFEVRAIGRAPSRNKTSFSLGCSNTLTLPRQYMFSVDFNYQGKNQFYAIEYGPYACLDLGAGKSFLDNKLSVRLQITDCFKWIKDRMVLAIDTVVYEQRSIYETRFVELTLNYRFNNYRKNYKGQNAAEKDMERL